MYLKIIPLFFTTFGFLGFSVEAFEANFVKIKPRDLLDENGNKYTFLMGSAENEVDRNSDETLHKVLLNRKYEIQNTELTQEQWFEVMGNNPSSHSEKKYCPGLAKDGRPAHREVNGVEMCRLLPVETVYIERFAERLNNSIPEFLEKLNGCTGSDCPIDAYRLPTEAEWEYAARGGPFVAVPSGPVGVCDGTLFSTYFFGSFANCGLENFAFWSDDKATYHPLEVATLKPNPAGLFDVYGNVSEWLGDAYTEDYGSDLRIDPELIPKIEGGMRVIRGGSFRALPPSFRSANRSYNDNGISGAIGFRLARTLN